MAKNLEEKNAIDEFRDLLSHWMNVYKWQNCSYFAIKTPIGMRLVFGRIIFETEMFKYRPVSFNIETKSIIAGRKISRIASDTIEQRLHNAKEGKITFSEHTFIFKNFYIHYHPIYHPSVTSGPRFPSLILREKERHEKMTMDRHLLGWELKSADQPFDSVEDLLVHIGLPELSEMGESSALEIVASSPARISNESKITDGQASIILNVSAEVDVNSIKLGFNIISNKSQTERFSVHGEKIKWTKNEGLPTGDYSFEVKKDANWLKAFISYNELALHDQYVFDPQKQTNPRYSIHCSLDEDLEILKKFLFESGKDSRNFESGIALLLNVLGFSVLHYGQIPRLKEGSDIIALTPEGNICVIECTISLLDKEDKLAKLTQRTINIKEKLKKTGFGFLSVQPVIVSMLPKAEVTGHLEEAGKHDIVVVCKEELTELFNRAAFPPEPERLFKEAARLIPNNNQLSLLDSNKA